MTEIFPWQQAQWDLLIKSKQRIPHALLINGAAGMGKFTFAKALAEFLLCSSPASHACGVCQHCQLLQAQTHPDFYLIQPEESKNIKVEQIRFLSEKLGQTPQLSTMQVVILYPAEAMNSASANALLKTLEEPVGHVVMMLVSHQPSLLPPTVRSRCQLINFSVTNKTLVTQWLQQQTPAPIEKILSLAALAEFVPLKALQLISADEKQNLPQEIYQLMTGKESLLKLATRYTKENPSEILKKLIMLSHDMMKVKQGLTCDHLLYQEQYNLLQLLAKLVSFHELIKIQTELASIQRMLNKNINLNPQLLIESLFIIFTERANSHAG